jgi:DNA-directed RNA polymerase subunit alpha
MQTDADVEIINRNHVLATLTEDVPFLMEMVVENGRGYVPATEHSAGEIHEIGIIPIDAVFSPVPRRLRGRETRVGQKTNYDKLTLEIWTNGSFSRDGAGRGGQDSPQAPQPVRAVHELGAACIRCPRRTDRGGPRAGAKLNMTIAELSLSVRAANCLESENIHTVRDLVQHNEDQLLDSPQLRRDDPQRSERETHRPGTSPGHAGPALY